MVTGERRRCAPAANVDKGWVDTDARACSASGWAGCDDGGQRRGRWRASPRCTSAPGAAARALVILLTFGTGIGSAVFTDGVLVPNTELGHLELDGHDAEKRASSKVKDGRRCRWEHWAHRVQKYLAHVEMLFSPELFIIGGGVGRKSHKFLPHIEGIRAEIVPAQLQNNAGIVGAAMRAAG